MRRTHSILPKPDQETDIHRPDFRGVALLDLNPAFQSDEKVATEQLKQLIRTAPILLCAHMIGGAALMFAIFQTASTNALLLATGLIFLTGFLDATFSAAGQLKVLASRPPHVGARIATVYGLLVGASWGALLLLGADQVQLHEQTTAAVALLGAGTVAALVMASVPIVLMVHWIMILCAMAFHAGNVGLILPLAGICICISGVAIANARRRLVLSRLRYNRDVEAQRAHQLLAEFEAGGKAWLWETDTEGRLTYISSQLSASVGGTEDALLGQKLTELIVADNGESLDRGAGERTLGFHLSTRLAFSELMVRANVPGPVRWWSISGRPAYDELKRFTGFRGVGTDLTEMRRSEAEINRLARYDALTGLPNRVVMHQTLDQAVRGDTRTNDVCALFLLDLDRFKSVNDTLGHPVGDTLLTQVADRLVREIGERGRCGRLGGDEFNVVLPGLIDQNTLAHLAERVIASLSQPYVIEGSTISIGASVGIAIAPKDGDCADALVRNADLALYAAKSAGKGIACFYEPAMHADAKDRRLLETDLRNVLRDDGLHLVYQPVVSARDEQIVGFEALLRWNHATRGPVSPSVFIPIAEEIGLIPAIGEWVIRTACAEAATWPSHVRVAVNLSPLQFASPALPGIVMSALAASQLPPERLELEITEGVFLNDSTATDEMFARLQAIGVRLALDDFGTGYSSLGYLKKAPFSKIKIDQSFVRGAAIVGNRNAAIIKAIVALAESLDMETTAEGAETHDELELIRSLGCSHIQGYIFGKPMPAEDARHLMSRPVIEKQGFTASRRPRSAILRFATVHLGQISFPIRLRNVSEGGAMAETTRAIAVGSPLIIELGEGQMIPATVVWAENGRIGLRFDEAYPEPVIIAAPQVTQPEQTVVMRRRVSRRGAA